MTVKDLKRIVNDIPNRDDDRSISFCGDLMISQGSETLDAIDISWIDCSDAILICINKDDKTMHTFESYSKI